MPPSVFLVGDVIAWVRCHLSYEILLPTADVVNVCLVAMDAAEEHGDLLLQAEYRTVAQIILFDSFAEAYRERMDAALVAHGRYAGARVLASWRRCASLEPSPPSVRRQDLLQNDLLALRVDRCWA